MPLTAGLRDEENERINNILKRLLELVYVPDWDADSIDSVLKDAGMTLETLEKSTADEVLGQVENMHFDWDNAEKFADFLIEISKRPPYGSLRQKAAAVYEYIQRESKTFSFGISNKIASAKKEQ